MPRFAFLPVRWVRVLALFTSCALFLSPSSSFASDRGKGAGFVLLTSLLRNRTDLSPQSLFVCINTFQIRKNENGENLYEIYSMEIYGDRLNIFTKTAPDNSCTSENLEVIEERHPCLADHLDQALQEAIEKSEEAKAAYKKLQQEGLYLGNVDPQNIRYRVIISSFDEAFQTIDLDAWDLSWLSEWNPFSEQRDCPFEIEWRQELVRPGHAPQMISRTRL